LPSWPGQAVLPNSAPDWFTPKYLNLVRDPEHEPVADVVVDELVLVVVVVVFVGETVEDEPVVAPARHWE
jgi:hypothetical protein